MWAMQVRMLRTRSARLSACSRRPSPARFNARCLCVPVTDEPVTVEWRAAKKSCSQFTCTGIATERVGLANIVCTFGGGTRPFPLYVITPPAQPGESAVVTPGRLNLCMRVVFRVFRALLCRKDVNGQPLHVLPATAFMGDLTPAADYDGLSVFDSQPDVRQLTGRKWTSTLSSEHVDTIAAYLAGVFSGDGAQLSRHLKEEEESELNELLVVFDTFRFVYFSPLFRACLSSAPADAKRDLLAQFPLDLERSAHLTFFLWFARTVCAFNPGANGAPDTAHDIYLAPTCEFYRRVREFKSHNGKSLDGVWYHQLGIADVQGLTVPCGLLLRDTAPAGHGALEALRPVAGFPVGNAKVCPDCAA